MVLVVQSSLDEVRIDLLTTNDRVVFYAWDNQMNNEKNMYSYFFAARDFTKSAPM